MEDNKRKNNRRRNIHRTKRKNTRNRNIHRTKRKNTRNRNIHRTKRKNTRNRNTRNTHKTRKKNTLRSKRRNTRKSRRKNTKKLKGGATKREVLHPRMNWIEEIIKCQIKGKGGIEDWSVRITLEDKHIYMVKGLRIWSEIRTADLRGCKVSTPKKSRGEGKYWLRVDLQNNDNPTYSGKKLLKNSAKKYVFGFDTGTKKKLWENFFKYASFNERVEDEIIIDYGQEGIQQIAELLKQTGRQTRGRKHTVLIMCDHGRMKEGNFFIPDGVEVIMKASTGRTTKGYNNLYLRHHEEYLYFNAINHHITQGDIVDDEGCVNPELAYALTSTGNNTDISDMNVKISGKSDGRGELPEAFKEDGKPKQQLTNSEIRGIDPEILRQYYANNVTMVFTNKDYYEKHGLLFEVQVNIQQINDEVAELKRSEGKLSATDSSRAQMLSQILKLAETEPGKEKYKVRLSLVTPEEKSHFRGRIDIPINGRVMETLTKLREYTEGHEFAVLFDACRVYPSSLNKQLSHKTDKSIDCWLKWYRDLIIENYGEEFFTELSEYLKTAFSSMNDVYDTLLETIKGRLSGLMSHSPLTSSSGHKIITICNNTGEPLEISFRYGGGMNHFKTLDSEKEERIGTYTGALWRVENSDNFASFEFSIDDTYEESTKIEFTLETMIDIGEALISGNKKEIIDHVLLGCFLKCLSGSNFEESLFRKFLGLIPEKISSLNQETLNGLLISALSSISPITKSAIQFLLENGANIEAPTKDGISLLISAVSRGNIEVVNLLLEKGVNIEAPTKEGITPLIFAIKKNNLEVVNFLLEKGANIEAPTEGITPLMFAVNVNGGNIEIVKILVENGANIDPTILPYTDNPEIREYLSKHTKSPDPSSMMAAPVPATPPVTEDVPPSSAHESDTPSTSESESTGKSFKDLQKLWESKATETTD